VSIVTRRSGETPANTAAGSQTHCGGSIASRVPHRYDFAPSETLYPAEVEMTTVADTASVCDYKEARRDQGIESSGSWPVLRRE
jgi:hypothetical protein